MSELMDRELVAFEKWWDEHGQYCRAGGGNYERSFAWEAWKDRAEQAEAALSVAQRDAAKHLATVYGAWTNHRSIDGNEDNQVVILTMKETNDLHDFLESIAHGGAGEGEKNG